MPTRTFAIRRRAQRSVNRTIRSPNDPTCRFRPSHQRSTAAERAACQRRRDDPNP